MLRLHVSGDAREEADRCAMLRLVDELAQPFSRDEPSAHFTASAFVVDEQCLQTCLVEHPKLGGLLQPGGHLEEADETLEAAAVREAGEETSLELTLHPDAPRPFDVDIHGIPPLEGRQRHMHLDVRYLLIGRGEPAAGAAWYRLGEAGDASVGRLAEKVRSLAKG